MEEDLFAILQSASVKMNLSYVVTLLTHLIQTSSVLPPHILLMPRTFAQYRALLKQKNIWERYAGGGLGTYLKNILNILTDKSLKQDLLLMAHS